MDKIIFLHIPKTAGSTLRSVFEEQYNPESRYLISAGNTLPPEYQYQVAKKSLININNKALDEIKFVYGHLPFDPSYFSNKHVRYSAFMREPISRVISSYNYILTTPHHPLYPFVKNLSIVEYAGNKNLQLDNLQLRIISGKTYGDINETDLEKAKNNIAKNFSFIGITEHFELSLLLMKKKLNWTDYPSYKNINITSSKKSVSDEEVKKLKDIYKYDIQLYSFALENFLRNIHENKEYFDSELENFRRINDKQKLRVGNIKKKEKGFIVSSIRLIFNRLGFDIIRFHQLPKKHIETDNKVIATSLISNNANDLSYYETATGNYYLPTKATKDIIAKAIINNEIFEKEVVELAQKYIKKNTSVLDVGSNFGQMAVLFANSVGVEGKVYAFEADDFIYSILKKNISANKLDGKVIPNFGAVHNKTNETLIFPEHNLSRWDTYGAYGIDYNAKEGRQVKTLTIDSLNIEEPISFMKVDVQGGDLLALQGAVKTIEKNKMPILFEYEYHLEEEFNLCFQDYVDFVNKINYRFHKVINGHNFLIIPKK